MRYGDQRTNFFEFNRGVRQGCILSPILFNLYSNELPHILDSHDQDPVTLPNGLPLNCLLYADDLVLISRSAAGLQNQINLLHKYSEKWLLTTNLKKTKRVVFQKQNRKSTREKYRLFLNRNKTPIGVNAGGDCVTLRYGSISHIRNYFAMTSWRGLI